MRKYLNAQCPENPSCGCFTMGLSGFSVTALRAGSTPDAHRRRGAAAERVAAIWGTMLAMRVAGPPGR